MFLLNRLPDMVHSELFGDAELVGDRGERVEDLLERHDGRLEVTAVEDEVGVRVVLLEYAEHGRDEVGHLDDHVVHVVVVLRLGLQADARPHQPPVVEGSLISQVCGSFGSE